VAQKRKTAVSRRPAQGEPFEAAYRAAFKKFGRAEITLDWRKLGRRRWTGETTDDGSPALWPGALVLFAPEDLEKENARLRGGVPPNVPERLLFIGSNTAGIVFALDQKGRVIVFDEIEASEQEPKYGQLLASDIDGLLAARVRVG
jgi:hypothetical protein